MPLQAGFSRIEITPPLAYEIPGGFFKNFATDIHDPLFVRAAWLDDGDTAIAIVSVECVFFTDECYARARELAREWLGQDFALLMAATHTHSGGPTGDVLMSEADPRYVNWVAEQAATAITLAAKRALPCQLGAGVGAAEGVAFNRRFRMKDGTTRTNPGFQNPDMVERLGPDDPAVPFIAAFHGGDIAGCIVNFACHSTFMGGSAYSGDYAAQIEQSLGYPTVFLPGAIGDVNQCDFVDGKKEEASGEGAASRAGRVIKEGIMGELMEVIGEPNPVLRAKSQTIDLPLRGPTPEQVAEAKETWANRGEMTTKEVYARELILLDEMLQQQDSISCRLQALQIGPMRIGAAAVQPFCQIGLDVKEGFGPAMFVGLANGHLGYVGYEHHYVEGGYELDLKRTSKLAPGTGETIVERLRKLMADL